DIAFQRQDIRAVLTQHRSGWGSVFSHSILSSSLHHLLGVSERSKGGEKQIEWLTEQTRAMAATTHDVQFTPAFPRYDHSENLDRLWRQRSLVSAPARSSVASINPPVRRSGWCQTVATAWYLDLTLLALLKPPPHSCTAIDLALRLQIKN